MDRKKTILIAVMVNAGLLVVLFIASLSSREEMKGEIVQAPPATVNHPLFPSVADQVLQTPQIVPAPIAVIPEITHKLPSPVVEQAPVPMPAVVKVIESKMIEVSVKKGDTLDKIAKANHTTADEIIKLNQLPGSFLKVGQVLKMPEPKMIAAVASKPATTEKQASTTGPEYYIVKVGDNPWGIAMKHHIKLEELLKLNQLNEEKARKLKPGDRLRTR